VLHGYVSCGLQGLEDQLLAEVVRQERPELEEQRDRLVVSIAADKRQLQELEVRKAAAGNVIARSGPACTLPRPHC
jgi:hypothetical protein